MHRVCEKGRTGLVISASFVISGSCWIEDSRRMFLLLFLRVEVEVVNGEVEEEKKRKGKKGG